MAIQRVSILGKILFMLAASSFASSQDATPFRFHGDKGPAHKIISQEWKEVVLGNTKKASRCISKNPFVISSPKFSFTVKMGQDNSPDRNYYSPPSPESRVIPVCAYTAQNQYESLIFGIFANTELKNISVSLSELKNENGLRIPAKSVQLRLERLIPRKITYDYKKKSGTFSYINGPLEKFENINKIPALRSRYVWLLIHISDNQPAGLYKGTLTFSTAERTENVPVQIRVYPFKLKPVHRSYGFFISGNPWSTKYLVGLKPENWTNMFRLWKNYGINYASLYVTASGTDVQYKNGKVSVITPEVDKVISMIKTADMGGPVSIDLRFALGKCKKLAKNHPELGKKDYEWLAEVVKVLLKRAKKLNWPEIIFIPGEEASIAPKWFLGAKLGGGTTLAVDNSPNGPSAFGRSWGERWQEWIDINQPNQVAPLLTARAKAAGAQIWAYNLKYNRLRVGLMLDKMKVTGYAQWAGEWPLLDPYFQLNKGKENRCWMATFPGEKFTLPSANLEVMRTAIDDSRFRFLLESLLKKKRPTTKDGARIIAEAQRTLKEIDNALPATTLDLGQFKDLNNYVDHFRRRIAKSIISLQQLDKKLEIKIPKTNNFKIPVNTEPVTDQKKKPGEAGYSIINRIDGAILVWIPATGDVNGKNMRQGAFLMGRQDGEANEQPVHEVALKGFWMYKTEVTVEQWRKFLKATKFDKTPKIMPYDEHPSSPQQQWNEKNDMAVTFVNRDYAMAYAKWAGGQLPTEAQWEWAARGPEGNLYTWGNQWKAEYLGFKNGKAPGKISGVYAYPKDYSWCGVVGLISGVREWTHDRYDAYKNYYEISPRENPQGFEQGIVLEEDKRWNIGADRSMYTIRGGCSAYGLPLRQQTTGRYFCDFGFEVHALTGFRLIIK